MTLPTHPRYRNDAGQAIYFVDGAAHGSRTQDQLRLLVVHHTAGKDSRLYLQKNDLNSSTTYLVGAYPDTNGPRIYKYMSEATDAPYTQGYGKIGSLDTGAKVNAASIAIECEGGVRQPNGALFMDGVIEETAKLAASIIRYWREQGIELVLLGHKHIDPRKSDPQFSWLDFCKRTYGYL